jgi:arylsulfatase
MADDMGFSDAGCFGGEIDTPNIDRLAEGGLSYTRFYNTGRCCPTRASLLTGLYAHQTGMGWMTAADLGRPAYSGDLNRNCVTIAEALQGSGYKSYLSGKWHVTHDRFITPEGPKHNWPIQRGFDRYYGPLNGGGSYFTTQTLTVDNEQIQAPDGFYVTDAITDHACEFISDHQRQDQSAPFFLYCAYTSPHFPLHAKAQDIEKYRGHYTKGWEELRAERYARMVRARIISPDWALSERDGDIRAWQQLSAAEKEEMDLRMAIYAAQIDCMDQGIGRLLATLERSGELEDTLILFLSDNGGTHESISRGQTELEALGTDLSYESYRKSWANLSNTPFRLYKHWVHEGGISTPLIAHWPSQIRGGQQSDQVGHVIDILPTFLEVSGADYPTDFAGHQILPPEGQSLVPSFENEAPTERTLFWEHEANRAVRVGDRKLVSRGLDSPWELYDLDADRTELRDQSAENSPRVRELKATWQQWAERCGVLPLDGRGWVERIEFAKS